jgi:hypothetical protein
MRRITISVNEELAQQFDDLILTKTPDSSGVFLYRSLQPVTPAQAGAHTTLPKLLRNWLAVACHGSSPSRG